jgi:hypothetical protein
MPPERRRPFIADPHSVPETFITSVVDGALVNGCTIAVTLGVRRYVRPNFSVEHQETVVINSRLVLTLDAARNLVELVSVMLGRAKQQSAPERPDKLS